MYVIKRSNGKLFGVFRASRSYRAAYTDSSIVQTIECFFRVPKLFSNKEFFP